MALLLNFSISKAVFHPNLLSYKAISSFLQAGQIISSVEFLLQRLHNFRTFPGVNGFMKYRFAFIVRNSHCRVTCVMYNIAMILITAKLQPIYN